MRLREVGSPRDENLVQSALKFAQRLRHSQDLQPLLQKISRSKVVMLGEASHGTHEFYAWRAAISRELIENHGFRFIAVEGDWPPAWQLNNFLHGRFQGGAEEALRKFHRWPTWMWANREMIELATWLRSRNEKTSDNEKAGFYGLDVYSLFESIEAILEQTQRISPFLARRLRTRYECFEPFSANEKSYARSLLQFPEGCQEAVMANLHDLLHQRLELTSAGENRLFDARQNARIVANAENYFRAMVHGTDDSWNVRDRHMHETLSCLLEHYGPESKAIVWAHNTHVGDYRATDMVEQGQINIGGLARETWGAEAVSLVGFGTYSGEVIASHAWDGPMERMQIPTGAAGSYEAAFHKVAQTIGGDFFLDLTGINSTSALREVRGHRAIGVVYHSAYEQLGNYVPTSLAGRYDAFIFLDTTSALNPIDQEFDRNEIPETWPQGM